MNIKKPTITGLDIGSSKISAVMAEVDKEGAFSIISHVTMNSKGISRGMPDNLNEAIDSVSRVLAKLREKTLRRPANIYVNISGEDVKGSKSKGVVPLSLRGREVIKPDMTRCTNVASTISLPYDREIIHRIANNFSIDDQPRIKNPVGLFASRLSCEVYILTAGVNHIQNIYKCVNSAGYDIREVVYTGIADAKALLNKEEMEEGALLVNMGASLTEVSMFSGGALCDIDIIPIGAQDIRAGHGDTIELNNLSLRIASRAQMSGRIGSVILTGGMSFNDQIVELIAGKLPCPVRMGVVKDIKGDISSLEAIRATTAIGLCKYAYEKCQLKAAESKNVARRLSEKVVDIFNNYF